MAAHSRRFSATSIRHVLLCRRTPPLPSSRSCAMKRPVRVPSNAMPIRKVATKARIGIGQSAAARYSGHPSGSSQPLRSCGAELSGSAPESLPARRITGIRLVYPHLLQKCRRLRASPDRTEHEHIQARGTRSVRGAERFQSDQAARSRHSAAVPPLRRRSTARGLAQAAAEVPLVWPPYQSR